MKDASKWLQDSQAYQQELEEIQAIEWAVAVELQAESREHARLRSIRNKGK